MSVTLLVADNPCASLIVTRKLYVPAFENLAVVTFEAVVPFGVKLTAAGDVPVVTQVNFRFEDPPSSFAETDNVVVVNVTGSALELAATVTMGGPLIRITVDPVTPPLTAEIWNVPAVAPAVNNPPALMVPPPADQTNVVVIAFPN